jgi:hypothetical protein
MLATGPSAVVRRGAERGKGRAELRNGRCGWGSDGQEPGQCARSCRSRARQHVLLVVGLVIGIPLTVFGSTLLLEVIERFPELPNTIHR